MLVYGFTDLRIGGAEGNKCGKSYELEESYKNMLVMANLKKKFTRVRGTWELLWDKAYFVHNQI